MTPEQLNYVKGELSRGVDAETLRATLSQNGYNEELIVQLMSAAQNPNAPQPNPNPVAQSDEKSSMFKLLLIILGVGAVIVIGLSAIVLASLNDARDAGMNASAQQMLNNTRAQVEIYFFENTNSYAGFCESSGFQNISSYLEEFAHECEAATESYRVSTRLISDGAGPEYFCVDSTGYANKVSSRPDGLSCE